jgi:drug/metabolite transporter (DMT)-like permease
VNDLSPYSRAANAIEGCGAIGIFLGVIAVVGVFFAWLDIGEWVPPVYWGAAIGVGLLLTGVGLFLAGDRWNRRCRQRWERRRG